MKKIAFLFILFSVCAVHAQTAAPKSASAGYAPGDTLKAKHLNDVSWQAIYKGKFDSATYYIHQSLAISSSLDYKKGIASCYNTMAAIYRDQGQLKESEQAYKVAINILEGLHNLKALSRVYGGLALTTHEMGNFSQALAYNFKSLKLQIAIGDTSNASSTYHNIGMAYHDLKNYPEATRYYRLALAKFTAEEDSSLMSNAYNSLAMIYSEKEQYEQALDYYNRALFCAQRSQNLDIEGSAYNNIGAYYLRTKENAKALPYIEKAYEFYKALGDEEGLVPALTNLGVVYERLGKKEKALHYMHQALELSRKIESLKYIEACEGYLSDFYIGINDYKQAYTHYKANIRMRDSIFNNSNTKKALRAEVDYEFEKRRLRIHEEQIKKDLAAELAWRRQQTIIWVIGILLVLSAVISVLIVRQVRLRNRQRVAQMEQKLLRSQMNPHFIFNSLASIESYIYENEPKEAGTYLAEFSRLMRLILENSSQEFISLRKELEILKYYLGMQKLRFSELFVYHIEVDPALSVNDLLIPPMLLQPFIENAIEHGFLDSRGDGRIEISFIQKDKRLEVLISDNGIGIIEASKREGKSGHQSMAMQITRERVEILNKTLKQKVMFTVADLSAEGGSERGTRVTFSMPLLFFSGLSGNAKTG